MRSEYALLGMTASASKRLRSPLWALLILVSVAPAARAQQPGPEVEGLDALFIVGYRDSLIESACADGHGQSMFGGSVSYHTRGRTAIGGEVTYLPACERQAFTYYHPNLSLMAEGRFDLNHSRVARIYLVGGVGTTRSLTYYGPYDFRFDFVGGAGVRVRKDQFEIAPEIQVGPGMSIRMLVGLGLHIRGRH